MADAGVSFLKVCSLHPSLRERAGFRDAVGAALHGVTSEASGTAGGAPCPWSERHRFCEVAVGDHLRMP